MGSFGAESLHAEARADPKPMDITQTERDEHSADSPEPASKKWIVPVAIGALVMVAGGRQPSVAHTHSVIAEPALEAGFSAPEHVSRAALRHRRVHRTGCAPTRTPKAARKGGFRALSCTWYGDSRTT